MPSCKLTIIFQIVHVIFSVLTKNAMMNIEISITYTLLLFILTVNLAESSAEADSYDYRSEGYLIVRRSGKWGKLCLDALTRSADMERRINDLGKAVCSALTYR